MQVCVCVLRAITINANITRKRLFIAKTADMKVLMSGSAVHATKKWMHIYMHCIRQCMLVCVYVCMYVCIANWRWNVAVEFLVDSMPTHLFLFVKRSLILLHAHTHIHTLIETFVLVFSCCYFCGCIAPPQMTPPHAAHALYLSLSLAVCVCLHVCVWPHMHFATPTERRSQRRSQHIWASAVQFARSVFILLRSVIHVNVVVAVVAVSRSRRCRCSCHCLACLHLLWLCVTLVFPEQHKKKKIKNAKKKKKSQLV